MLWQGDLQIEEQDGFQETQCGITSQFQYSKLVYIFAIKSPGQKCLRASHCQSWPKVIRKNLLRYGCWLCLGVINSLDLLDSLLVITWPLQNGKHGKQYQKNEVKNISSTFQSMFLKSIAAQCSEKMESAHLLNN